VIRCVAVAGVAAAAAALCCWNSPVCEPSSKESSHEAAPRASFCFSLEGLDVPSVTIGWSIEYRDMDVAILCT
jgi:hypothetical protein